MISEEKKDKSISSISDFDDSGIFSDFSWDKDLKKEVQSFKNEQKRDWFDILNIFSWIFKSINLILIIVCLLWFWYIYIQNDEKFSDSSLIDPICFVFIGDDNIKEWSLCSSVQYTLDSYKSKIKELKDSQFKKIFSIIGEVYKSENFLNSKEIVFLKNNLEKKLKPTEIIDNFNKLTIEFNALNNKTSLNWDSIICDNLSINNENILKADCSSYANWWEKNIESFNLDINKKYSWSSISIANSFLNYISRQNTNFSLEERQKDFSLETNSWSLNQNITKFNLKLKYNKTNLSL